MLAQVGQGDDSELTGSTHGLSGEVSREREESKVSLRSRFRTEVGSVAIY